MDMVKFWVVTVLSVTVFVRVKCQWTGSWPHRILVDTDVDTDDFFALLYILKLNRSEFDLKAITINSNAWSNAGHAINHLYDILYMMDRDDIPIGVGGEGGILDDGSILPNVGGYLPIIEQGTTTVGGCRYRQAIPKGCGGRLDADTNYGIRKAFLPQGKRKYTPLRQPTAQEVMLETISAGPTTVFLIGAHTNLAVFIMKNPHLKENIPHIYIMGGGVRSSNPTGCCPNTTSSCKPEQCGDRGNLYTDYTSNPYAEFNVFGDPFAAYQVLHSGIPITIVPIDATNTIPISSNFYKVFERRQMTNEAQYCFQSLKIIRDTWFDDLFFTSYFMWDSFTSGIAVSIMRNPSGWDGENEFAEMEFMNITVVTSNMPYEASDGSNPLFDGRPIPKFDLDRDGVHSGHVQTGLRDPFCVSENGKGKCKDGCTEEVAGPDAVRVLVAKKAKPSTGLLDLAFYNNFLDTLNRPEQSGKRRFISTLEIHYDRKVSYNHRNTRKGRPVIFDTDMSVGGFLSLFFLLKVPVEIIDLKAVLVTATGWANPATVDVIYDVLHMMGRDDIPVGLGSVYAMDQKDLVYSGVGGCKYVEAVPQGEGGFLDSDTLYGLARSLPRSPRRYTAENSVEHGAPRNTGHPEIRQALAGEVWESVIRELPLGSKISLLTGGPLTTLATILSSDKNHTSLLKEVFILGGHIPENNKDHGNVYTVASNRFSEFNMFLDPVAAKFVFESGTRITLVPLGVQRTVSSFKELIGRLGGEPKTPEAVFSRRLLSLLNRLHSTHPSYSHLGMFMGELLGATLFACEEALYPNLESQKLRVMATGFEYSDGETVVDRKEGYGVRVLKLVNVSAHYDLISSLLGRPRGSAEL